MCNKSRKPKSDDVVDTPVTEALSSDTKDGADEDDAMGKRASSSSKKSFVRQGCEEEERIHKADQLESKK